MTRLALFIAFVIYPVATNVVLAVVDFFFSFQHFSQHHWLCYLAVAAALSAVISSFVGFVIHDLGPAKTLLSIATHAVAMMFIFAGIYRGYGLMFNGHLRPLLDDPQGALYFSVVTWTTLGYGDYSPPDALRLIAATEAIMGYVLFGVSIGLGTFLMSATSPAKR